METLLLFDKIKIDQYKKELSIVEDYYNKTKHQFDNIDKEADEYAKSFLNNYAANEYSDPADIADKAHDLASEFYENLSLMKSNHLLMTISMLYHIWEQQLIKFTIEEIEHYLNLNKNSLSYAEVQKIFESHGIIINDTKSWVKIRELKFLTNTIKHGDGDSTDKLRRIRPDFFEKDIFENTDTLEFYKVVLLHPFSLQVDENNLSDYIKATKNFWDEMPERAYSDTNSINLKLNELNK